MTTVLLHGFWGQPSDWNAVLQRLPLGAPVWLPDLYEVGPHSPQHSLQQWVGHFLDELERRFSSEPVQVVGYSMGGRLALNAIAQAPRRFTRTLLVSSAPFLVESAEQRQTWEAGWRERFLNEPWESLERDWQMETIFKNSAPLERRKTPEIREMLALSLVNWSPTRHLVDPEGLKTLKAPVDWVFGAHDQKYLNYAKLLREMPVQGQISIIENAGHRILTDAPETISDWVTQGGL